jgi:hypothetical protein
VERAESGPLRADVDAEGAAAAARSSPSIAARRAAEGGLARAGRRRRASRPPRRLSPRGQGREVCVTWQLLRGRIGTFRHSG